MNRELWLSPWRYNTIILVDMLEKYITGIGGELRGYYRTGKVHLHDHDTGTTYATRETSHCDTFGTHTSFILNGDYYYIEIDDNPFFDFHCHKIHLDNGKINGTYYLDNLKKNWVIDELFTYKATETDLNRAFEIFVNAVMEMPDSKRFFDKNKRKSTEPYPRKEVSY